MIPGRPVARSSPERAIGIGSGWAGIESSNQSGTEGCSSSWSGLVLDLSVGTVQLAKRRAARGNNPPFDVVQMLDEQMDIAVREGLIDPFDASEVPNIKSLYTISTPSKWQKDGKYFSAHQNWGQLGLTYRTDRVKTPPKEGLEVGK